MKIAVFWGCRILTDQYAYEMSVRELLPAFQIRLVDLSESSCCGDPLKSVNNFAADYLGARILAVANLTGLTDLLVPCNRCHFTISEAMNTMRDNQKLGEKIKSLLKEENLKYNPNIKLWHIIDFLHDCVGLEKIKNSLVTPLNGLNFATHVGCQLIRYSDLKRPDRAENPFKLDDLVSALGATSVDYDRKLDCCGSGLMYAHPNSALALAGSKLKSIKNSNVDGLVVSCPECQMMFDAKQADAQAIVGAKFSLPVIYLTQLMGLALGLSKEKIGLDLNQSPIDQLLTKIPLSQKG